MQIFFPSYALQSVVKRYVFISTRGEVISNTLLPDTSITLAFRLKGTTLNGSGHAITPLPATVITGLRTQPRIVTYEANSACIVVVFHTMACSALFKSHPYKFFDNTIALKDVISNSSVSMLEERLQATETASAAIIVIEEFLLSNLYLAKPDTLVSEGVRLFTTTCGKMRVRDVTDHLCISQDAFEKRFRKVVGSTPKHFARTVRLRSIINHNKTISSVTALALEAGYFDSAHFNKDFKSFTGQSPSAFFKQPVFW